MEELIQDLIEHEILNHNLGTFALISFLAEKGIINASEFLQYQDEYARKSIKTRYPDLPL